MFLVKKFIFWFASFSIFLMVLINNHPICFRNTKLLYLFIDAINLPTYVQRKLAQPLRLNTKSGQIPIDRTEKNNMKKIDETIISYVCTVNTFAGACDFQRNELHRKNPFIYIQPSLAHSWLPIIFRELSPRPSIPRPRIDIIIHIGGGSWMTF